MDTAGVYFSSNTVFSAAVFWGSGNNPEDHADTTMTVFLCQEELLDIKNCFCLQMKMIFSHSSPFKWFSGVYSDDAARQLRPENGTQVSYISEHAY